MSPEMCVSKRAEARAPSQIRTLPTKPRSGQTRAGIHDDDRAPTLPDNKNNRRRGDFGLNRCLGACFSDFDGQSRRRDDSGNHFHCPRNGFHDYSRSFYSHRNDSDSYQNHSGSHQNSGGSQKYKSHVLQRGGWFDDGNSTGQRAGGGGLLVEEQEAIISRPEGQFVFRLIAGRLVLAVKRQ